MLSIIDRYIIRKFLTTFFFMLGIIMLFAMVFDISEKLSEFINFRLSILNEDKSLEDVERIKSQKTIEKQSLNR